MLKFMFSKAGALSGIMVFAGMFLSFFLWACSTAESIRTSDIQPISIVNVTISKDIKSQGYLSVPVEPAYEFTHQDNKVVAYVDIIHLSGEHQIRWEWYTPQGILYQTTGNRILKAPKDQYVGQAAACHAVDLKDQKMAAYPGKWQVNILLDDRVVETQNFFVKGAEEKDVFKEIAGIDFGNYYALVIGINNYTELNRLKSANKDAEAVAATLRAKYNFKVTLLLDAMRSDIINALDQLRSNLTEKDNLLIYYAGHGFLDEAADEGYWMPKDASVDSTLNWISNANITAAIKAMRAKHVLVVADSCYAGKLIRGLNIRPSHKTTTNGKRSYYQSMSGKKTRSVLCSGGLEPVVDSDGKNGHSVFAAAFIDVLSRNKSIMDGTQLFFQLRRPVVLNADQTPEYSDIRKAGHDGGDFLFVSQHLLRKEP